MKRALNLDTYVNVNYINTVRLSNSIFNVICPGCQCFYHFFFFEALEEMYLVFEVAMGGVEEGIFDAIIFKILYIIETLKWW